MIRYFLLGALTVYVIIPIIDSLLGVIIALLEFIKGYFSLKIAKINESITQISEPKVEEFPQIGFLRNTEAEECDSEA